MATNQSCGKPESMKVAVKRVWTDGCILLMLGRVNELAQMFVCVCVCVYLLAYLMWHTIYLSVLNCVGCATSPGTDDPPWSLDIFMNSNLLGSVFCFFFYKCQVCVKYDKTNVFDVIAQFMMSGLFRGDIWLNLSCKQRLTSIHVTVHESYIGSLFCTIACFAQI